MIKDPGEVEEATVGANADIEVMVFLRTRLSPLGTDRDCKENKADSKLADEDDYDRRPQRRRYEEPLSVKVRKQLLSIAESPLKRVEDEVASIAKTVADNFEDAELRRSFEDLILQLVVEQPFKIPFVAAVVLVMNGLKGEIVEGIIGRAVVDIDRAVKEGEWREVKLLMKFLGGLQGILEGDGVFPVLQDLLTKAVELQTENSDDVSTT